MAGLLSSESHASPSSETFPLCELKQGATGREVNNEDIAVAS
jgi:hypothetical protein